MIFGRQQLMQAREDHRQSIRMQNAQTFLEVEARWNSRDMVDARLEAYAFRDQINVVRQYRTEAETNERLVEALVAMRSDASTRDRFTKIMEPVMFFETVGLMCREDRRYVEILDVFDLIGPSLEEYDEMMGPFIRSQFEDWANEQTRDFSTGPGRLGDSGITTETRPDGPMANAIFLMDRYADYARSCEVR